MTTPEPVTTPELGLFSRAVGVMFSPAATFKTVVASPRSAAILFLVCLVMGLATGAPLFSKQVQQSFVETQLRTAALGNTPPPPETRQVLERMAPYAGYLAIGQMFILLPVMSLLIAGLYWLLFNVVLGGTADYKQVLAIVTHSQVIAAAGALLAAPIVLTQGLLSPVGPFHLGALAASLDPTHSLSRLLNALTFFGVWQSIVTAIGLAVLYRRKVTGIAITLLFIYVALTAFFFVLLPSLFGSR